MYLRDLVGKKVSTRGMLKVRENNYFTVLFADENSVFIEYEDGNRYLSEINGRFMLSSGWEEYKEPKNTGYERSAFCAYWKDNDGSTMFCTDENNEYNKQGYKSGNYYSNPKVAENNIRADKLMRQLRRFAAKNGGCVAPINYYEERYSIKLEDGYGVIPYRVGSGVSGYGLIYFCTKEAAQKAIEIFKDELIWYFTEYEPMPEGWWDE